MSKAKKPAALSDQLRAAIVGSGLSIYAIAKSSGVSHPVILRFVSKQRGLQIETVDKLAAFLGLELCKVGKSGRTSSGLDT